MLDKTIKGFFYRIRILVLFLIVLAFLVVAADATLDLRGTFIRLVMSSGQTDWPFIINDSDGVPIFAITPLGHVNATIFNSTHVNVTSDVNGTRLFQGPNRTVIPDSCSGTDKISAINADGSVTCSSDESGGGGGGLSYSIIGGKTTAALSADAFMHPVGEVAGVTAYDEEYGMEVPFNAKIHNITMWMDVAQGSGDSCSIVVRNSTSCLATSTFTDRIWCNVTNVAQNCRDTTGSFITDASSCIYVFFDEVAGTCSATISWSFIMTPN